jgi:hypothetical protein
LDLRELPRFHDIFTDVVGASLPHSLDDNQDIIVHEGIFTAATMVADDLLDFIQQLILPQKFKVVITGQPLLGGRYCMSAGHYSQIAHSQYWLGGGGICDSGRSHLQGVRGMQ